MDDPRIRQAKINCVTFTFVTTFEIIWFAYGNYEIYGSKLRDFEDKNLWKLMIVILAYGYLQTLIYLGSVCAGGFVLYTLYSDGYFNKEKTDQYTDKLAQKNSNEIVFDPNVMKQKFPSISATNNQPGDLNNSGTEGTLGQSVTSSQIIKNGVISFNVGTEV